MSTRLLTTTIVLTLLLALASLPALAGNKVDVCHLPPGNPDNWHTISVSSNALGAHLGHGDLEGSCAENCEALCDDSDACTQDIESDFNQCICNAEPRPAVDCDDSNPCTVDGCNSEFGCTYDAAAANGDACDDGDPGTSDDVCTDGVCAGTSDSCCTGAGFVCNDAACRALVCEFPPAGQGLIECCIFGWDDFQCAPAARQVCPICGH